jgi:hypothetical protein
LGQGVKEKDWAYLAGFMDGEACISATSRRSAGGSYGAQINTKQKVPDSLIWAHGKFKVGYISPRKHDVWWRVRKRREVKWLLEGLLPYLILKRPQAVVAIELCSRPITVERTREINQLLKDLKRPPHIYDRG